MENFFRDLYDEKHKTVNSEQKESYIKTADDINKSCVPP